MYTHKSLREKASSTAGLAPVVLADPAPLNLRVLDGTRALVLGHRAVIRAGVPGCTCSAEFACHTTFTADHAQHLAAEVVPYVLGHAIRTLEAAGDPGPESVLALLRDMSAARLGAAPEPVGV